MNEIIRRLIVHRLKQCTEDELKKIVREVTGRPGVLKSKGKKEADHGRAESV